MQLVSHRCPKCVGQIYIEDDIEHYGENGTGFIIICQECDWTDTTVYNEYESAFTRLEEFRV